MNEKFLKKSYDFETITRTKKEAIRITVPSADSSPVAANPNPILNLAKLGVPRLTRRIRFGATGKSH